MADAEKYAQWIVQNADKRGTPEFETVAQAYQAAKQQSRGNIINTDVPTVVGEVPNPAPIESKPTSMMDKLKALYEVPTAIFSEAVRQPLAHAYGVAESIPHAIVEGKTPAELGPKYTAQALQAIPQYQPTSPASQNVLQSIGNVVEAAKLPPTPNAIGEIPSFQKFSKPATNQVAQALRNEGQMIREAATPYIQKGIETVKPMATKVAETVEPMGAKMANVLRSEPKIDLAGIAKTAPKAEELAIKSDRLFDVARDAGIQINPKEFATNMKQIAKSLEDIGYDPELHPDIATVIKRLTDPNVPKDFNKIKALRTMIGDLQSADTKLKRSIATNLKEDFDSYLATIPESSVTSGSKEGLNAWKEARDTYAKLSKSEIFTDMLEKAELDKSKFTQSGMENSLAAQLRNLAKNDKKMRMFTPEEQEAIKQAAKGGTMQNMLKFYGRFTPSGPVSGMFAGGMIYANPWLGIPLELGAIAARKKATKMRKQDIENLAAFVRAGGKKAEE